MEHGVNGFTKLSNIRCDLLLSKKIRRNSNEFCTCFQLGDESIGNKILAYYYQNETIIWVRFVSNII